MKKRPISKISSTHAYGEAQVHEYGEVHAHYKNVRNTNEICLGCFFCKPVHVNLLDQLCFTYACVRLASGGTQRKAVCDPYGFILSLRFTDVISGVNPLDARRRYTDFPQTSQCRQTAVYRPNGFLLRAPADGIPSIRFLGHSRRRTVYNLCFLMHTGPSIPES